MIIAINTSSANTADMKKNKKISTSITIAATAILLLSFTLVSSLKKTINAIINAA